MIELLAGLLGENTYNFFTHALSFLETLFCTLLFMLKHKKRRFFALRLVGCVIAGVAACIPVAIVNTQIAGGFAIFTRVMCHLLVSCMTFAVVAVCYKESASEMLMCWCSGVATNQVAGKLYPLIQNMIGIDDKQTISFFPEYVEGRDWTIFFIFQIVMYCTLALIFRRKGKLTKDKATSRSVAAIATITVLLVNGLICVSRVYESESYALNIVVKIFSIAFGLFVLLFCNGILSRSKLKQDLDILDQLWHQERLQFENVKASVETINMKCHDLKHMFSKLEGKLNDSEIDALKEAVEFYDASIKTGNEILDIVLCEKQMICRKNGIRLSCLADGGALAFMPPSKLYSLFGNALDNAIEAAGKLSDPEQKIISLNVASDAGRVEIEVSNYFDGSVELERGLPRTSKADSDRHGYGIKSMKYIVEELRGTLKVETAGNMFRLDIKLPQPEIIKAPPPRKNRVDR